jgi:hypothetical protein
MHKPANGCTALGSLLNDKGGTASTYSGVIMPLYSITMPLMFFVGLS